MSGCFVKAMNLELLTGSAQTEITLQIFRLSVTSASSRNRVGGEEKREREKDRHGKILPQVISDFETIQYRQGKCKLHPY